MNRLAAALAGLLALAALPNAAPAQTGVDIQRALDKMVELDVADAPIRQLFQRLTDATGVRFVLDDDVLSCLPYGDQTRLTVKLKNVTLRKALSPMLTPEALDWAVDKDAVRIAPMPALARMGRRATYEELDALGKIYAAELKPVEAGGPVIDQLRAATGNKDLRLFFHAKLDRDALLARAANALPANAARWLDMLCHGRQLTWYLWGDDITLMGRADQVERQLRRLVSLQYRSAPLMTVLLDLAHQARVQLNLDPGVLDYLSPETRENFNLIMAEASVAQALEVISGATGLVFAREADGVRVQASEALIKRRAAGATDPARPRTPFFLKKTIPLADGSTIEMLIRPDELPDDVAAVILSERDRLLDMVIRTCRPAATRPAETPGTPTPATTRPADEEPPAAPQAPAPAE